MALWIPYTLLCKCTPSEYGSHIWLAKWSCGILTGNKGGRLTSIRVFLYKGHGEATDSFGSATLTLNSADNDYLPISSIYYHRISSLDALSEAYYEYWDGHNWNRYYVATITLPVVGWNISRNTKYSLILDCDSYPFEYNKLVTKFRQAGGATQPPDLPTSNLVPYKTTYSDVSSGWVLATDAQKPNLVIDAEVLPTVTTDAATDVRATSATVNGTLDESGSEACDCSFEWGLTTGYGNTTTPETKNTGETFSAGLTGLVPGTTYHFRAKAVNSSGTFYGADRTFRSGGSIYPSVSTVRVSSLVHRWVPGSYTLECTLGGLTSDLGLVVPSGKPISILPTLPSCQPDELLAWTFEKGYHCIPKSAIPPEWGPR